MFQSWPEPAYPAAGQARRPGLRLIDARAGRQGALNGQIMSAQSGPRFLVVLAVASQRHARGSDTGSNGSDGAAAATAAASPAVDAYGKNRNCIWGARAGDGPRWLAAQAVAGVAGQLWFEVMPDGV